MLWNSSLPHRQLGIPVFVMLSIPKILISILLHSNTFTSHQYTSTYRSRTLCIENENDTRKSLHIPPFLFLFIPTQRLPSLTYLYIIILFSTFSPIYLCSNSKPVAAISLMLIYISLKHIIQCLWTLCFLCVMLRRAVLKRQRAYDDMTKSVVCEYESFIVASLLSYYVYYANILQFRARMLWVLTKQNKFNALKNKKKTQVTSNIFFLSNTAYRLKVYINFKLV